MEVADDEGQRLNAKRTGGVDKELAREYQTNMSVPTCSKCGKDAADHCRYFLCNHVLCIECDLLHDQLTCAKPSYLRKEREAITKARDIQDADGGRNL